MSRLKLWSGLIVLFGAGVLTGIVGTVLYGDYERAHRIARGPDAQHERIMKRLTQELSLTAEQQSGIEPIVTRAHVSILELRFSHQTEIERILARGMAELRDKLSAEQRDKLSHMYGQLEARWQSSRSHLESMKQTMPVSP